MAIDTPGQPRAPRGSSWATSRLRVAWLGLGVMVLAACSTNGGDPALRRAEAKVTVKERAVTAAHSEAAAATAAFCTASKTYIVALDRYGDVLHATAPTVGDVQETGADLMQPRESTNQAAQAAVEAQQQLSTAEEQLEEARSALTEVQRSAGGPTSTAPTSQPASTTTPLPSPPPAETVNRVKQAEQEFAVAQQGITDQTPLVQASEQFNAAAVALEMSWLRLYADAGCLVDDQQKKAADAVYDFTLSLQRSLSEAGYYQGQPDGVYGPETVAAVEALQQAHGLPVTGTVDKATAAALDADLQTKGGAAAQEAVASTAALQQTLHLAGFWDGPIDGTWTPELTDALKSFQAELGVKPTGTVDAATVAALERAIATAQEPEQTPSKSVPTTARSASVPTTAKATPTTTSPSSP